MPTFFEDIENKDMVVITVNLFGTDPATAANYEVFFIARRPYEVMEVAEAHRTAGTDAGAVSLNIERLSGTEALDAGDAVLVSAFDLKGAANTVTVKRGTDLQNRTLVANDRLALDDAGTLAAVAGLTVTILLRPLGKGDYR